MLADTRRGFRRIRVLDDGHRVRVEPGVTVRQVNAHLLRHGRRLGPDPASEIACTIGGVVANNSSGITSGSENNSYNTLESMTILLADGLVLDTSDAGADAKLEAAAPDLHHGLADLRDDLRSDTEAVTEIRRQFAIKNTMGYGINAFLDADRPIDILQKLMIGSEGTLGFVAEAVFRTVPLHPEVATGLMVFESMDAATSAVPALITTGARAIELMDAASLRVAQTDPAAPELITDLTIADHAALLVEWQAADSTALAADERRVRRAVRTLSPTSFALTRDAGERAELWHVRKGIYATIAESRPTGTSALLEDVAVPPQALSEFCAGLQLLFEQYGLGTCPIFGHARDGNIHFMLTLALDDPSELDRYARFTESMVELVLAYGGTLKAEHGTGRIMAPYVERQFGSRLYEVMTRVKHLLDPAGILNPGVVITDDDSAHLKNLKSTLPVEDEVDRCVECGYCEPVCPSKDLTLTPRQRIVARREIAAARARGDDALVMTLEQQYDYDGIDTCAVDGMCQVACPVRINTGDLVRRLRQQDATPIERAGWALAADHWGTATRFGAVALTVADAVPAAPVRAVTQVARAVVGRQRVPLYSSDLPRGGSRRARASEPAGEVVFMAACVNSMFDGGAGGRTVSDAIRSLAEKAGVALVVPAEAESLCCGTPWKSKGMTRGHHRISEATVHALREASDEWRLPIVIDASSCTEGLAQMLGSVQSPRRPAVIDVLTFAQQTLLPRLRVTEKLGSLMLHPTCSTARMGLDSTLVAIARAVADEVDTPVDWSCCAFAGDRGMLLPELTASATRREAEEVLTAEFDAYASSNRTCELALARATGKPYRHILELLDDAAAAL